MSGWRVLSAGWSFEPTDTEWSATRVLIADSGGSATPPALLDNFPASELPAGYTSSSLLCRKMRFTREDGEQADGKPVRWECHYSTIPSTGSSLPPEDEPQSLIISGEKVIQSNGDGAAAADMGSGEGPVKGLRVVWFPTAIYTKTTVYATFAAAITGVVATSIAHCLERASGVEDGYWIYLGSDLSEYRNNEGLTKTKSVRKYAWRSIDDGTATRKGWNFAWDPDNGEWRGPTSPLTYQMVSSFPDPMPAL